MTEESDPDLFWALRGGGGNFGIATSVHVPAASARDGHRRLDRPPDRAAGEMLRFYRDAVAECSDDLTVFAALVHAPDGSGMKLAAMVVFHAGDEIRPSANLRPSSRGARRWWSRSGAMPYPVMNTILDAGYPTGALNYWLSSFTRGLADELIDTMVERFAIVPSPMNVILLEHFHGAVRASA